MFNHVQDVPVLEQITDTTLESGRTYHTSKGDFPSITTVLGMLSKQGIQDWRKKVGEAEANRITKQASTRGTAVHQLAEDYINNKPDWKEAGNVFELSTFNQLRPILDRNLDNIWYQEAPLYSERFKMAGRVDCIGEWKGELAIIDFKTARKPKKYEWITNYFMQAAFYSAAFYERTGIPIKHSVIAISPDGSDPQIFEEETFPWLPALKDVRAKYQELYKV